MRESGRKNFQDDVDAFVERARHKVQRALATVGGAETRLGSVLWHVVGLEKSLKAWAIEERLRGRPIAEKAAAGVLIAALDRLASATLRHRTARRSRRCRRSRSPRRWASAREALRRGHASSDR
jgi:hypothetical protein